MRFTGLGLIALSVLGSAFLFAGLPTTPDTLALTSQWIGTVALILMAWAQIMATRLPGVEAMFGPLDRVYVLHKWSGITAMAAMLIHDTVDADIRGIDGGLLADFGETLGEVSLYGLLILAVISVATFIPYHLWKWTHKAMGAFFIAGSVHAFLIPKPFGMTDPLGLYIYAVCGLGALAYLYTLLPETMCPAHRYTLAEITQTGGATEVTLAPANRGVRHQPGQFALLRFPQAGGLEGHPFTLSAAARDDGQISVTIKSLGDHTRRMTKVLDIGQDAIVQGPFGRFTIPKGKRPQVWIAGGIGITPFVSWAEALPKQGADCHLIYCVRARSQAPHLTRIEALAASNPRLHVHLVDTSQGPRLTSEMVANIAGEDLLAEANVAYCGPTGLRDALRIGLRTYGVSARRFHFEAFEFRTGVGLEALALWVGKRAWAQVPKLSGRPG
jgi:predicted ferric reductase